MSVVEAGHGRLVQFASQKNAGRLSVPSSESARRIEGLDPLAHDLSQMNVDQSCVEEISRARVSHGRSVPLVGRKNVDPYLVDGVNTAEAGRGPSVLLIRPRSVDLWLVPTGESVSQAEVGRGRSALLVDLKNVGLLPAESKCQAEVSRGR